MCRTGNLRQRPPSGFASEDFFFFNNRHRHRGRWRDVIVSRTILICQGLESLVHSEDSVSLWEWSAGHFNVTSVNFASTFPFHNGVYRQAHKSAHGYYSTEEIEGQVVRTGQVVQEACKISVMITDTVNLVLVTFVFVHRDWQKKVDMHFLEQIPSL